MKPKAKEPTLNDCLKNPQFNLIDTLKLSAPEAVNPKRYFDWEELRYRKPPEGLDSAAWWVGVKLHRQLTRTELPLTDAKGEPFTYALMPQFIDQLHEIDVLTGITPDVFSGSKAKAPAFSDSIIEESIMSSKLEGAVVTRAEAKEMLRQNRPALNEHERMVRNNYRTMRYLLECKDMPLTPEIVLELHHLMTADTLSRPEKCGCLRSSEDWVRVEHAITGEIIHVPPPAEQLPERLNKMCAFANGDIGAHLHPILRAIVLHFWLAYDHPFVDGNGRTARALFYWVMLRAGYKLVEYISISHEIHKKSKGYYLSFQQVESEGYDVNYFIFNHLQIISTAFSKLRESVAPEAQEEVIFAGEGGGMPLPEDLNLRQQDYIRELRHSGGRGSISVTGYCNRYKVVRQTARTDLNALVEAGILTVRPQGRQFVYDASPRFLANV